MQTKIKSAEEAWTRGFVKQAVTAGLTEKQAFAILPAWGGSDWVTKRKMGLRGTAGYNYIMGAIPVPQIGMQFGTDKANVSLSGPIPSIGFGSGIPKDYSGKVDYNPPSWWKLLSDHRDRKNRKEKRAWSLFSKPEPKPVDPPEYKFSKNDVNPGVHPEVARMLNTQWGVHPNLLHSNTKLDDLGADELDHVELAMLLEEHSGIHKTKPTEYRVSLPFDHKFKTVSELQNFSLKHKIFK